MLRVPALNKNEIAALAELGALNELPKDQTDRHRRGAAWQASIAARPVGPLLEGVAEENDTSPLVPLTPTQRVFADFARSGLTIGKHPMAFHRARLAAMGVLDSATAKAQRNGAIVRVAGCVITRQRPGTAKGFVFLSLEDETGIVNIIVRPDLFDRKADVCVREPYLLIKGILQNMSNVISVKAADMEGLSLGAKTVTSHDFH